MSGQCHCSGWVHYGSSWRKNMASIRRKNDKWQAVIRRAGEATISRSFRSKTDARKWAIAAEQRLDRGVCGQINKVALNDSLGAYLDRYQLEISAFKACHHVERYIIGKWNRHGLARLPIGAVTTDRLLPAVRALSLPLTMS